MTSLELLKERYNGTTIGAISATGIQDFSSINDLDLELNDLKILEELFYRNINFLKEQQKQAGEELKNIKKMKSFLKH